VTNINIRSLVSFWLFDFWHLAHFRSRLSWLTESATRRQIHAIPIFLAALLLLLPLPVPFSTAMPEWVSCCWRPACWSAMAASSSGAMSCLPPR
jgi:hypothetical protein